MLGGVGGMKRTTIAVAGALAIACGASSPAAPASLLASPTPAAVATSPAAPSRSATPVPKPTDALAARFGLSGYDVSVVEQPKIVGAITLALGPNGAIYVRTSSGTVSVVDPVSGTVTRKDRLEPADEAVVRNFSPGRTMDHTFAADGTEYQALWQTGTIVRVEKNGSKTPIVTGLNVNDPIYLDFGPDGMLYFTDRRYGFARVSPSGGAIKTFDFLRGERNGSHVYKDFVFEPSGTVVFLDHGLSDLIRVSLTAETRTVLVPGALNTSAVAFSPQGDVYVGDTTEYPIEPSRILKFDASGRRSVIVQIPGLLSSIAVAPDGTLYAASSGKAPDRSLVSFWLSAVRGDGTLRTIVDRRDRIRNITSLGVDPTNGDLVGYDQIAQGAVRFSPDGSRETPTGTRMSWSVYSGAVAVDRRGGLWELFTAEEGQLRGPSVNRELYYVQPDGTAALAAKIPYLNGCCTMHAMNVGPDGAAYVIPSPEFTLLRVSQAGRVETLARTMPVDPAGIVLDGKGRIVFTSGSGVFMLTPR